MARYLFGAFVVLLHVFTTPSEASMSLRSYLENEILESGDGEGLGRFHCDNDYDKCSPHPIDEAMANTDFRKSVNALQVVTDTLTDFVKEATLDLLPGPLSTLAKVFLGSLESKGECRGACLWNEIREFVERYVYVQLLEREWDERRNDINGFTQALEREGQRMSHEKVSKSDIQETLVKIMDLDVSIHAKEPHFLEIAPDSDFTKVSLGLVVHYITLRLNVLGFTFFFNPSEVKKDEIIKEVGNMIWKSQQLEDSFKKDRLSRYTSKDKRGGNQFYACWYDRELRDDYHGCYWKKDFKKYWTGITDNLLRCVGRDNNKENKANEAEVNKCRDLHQRVIEDRQNDIFRELFAKPRESWERLRNEFEAMSPKRVRKLQREVTALRAAVKAEKAAKKNTL